METSEQKFQLRSGESRWRAATEVDGFRRQRKTRALLIEIAQYSLAKSPRLRAIEQIFVKSAVRADTRAKGDVNINMPNWVHCTGTCRQNCERAVPQPTRADSCDSQRYSYNRLVFARHDRTPERSPHSVLRHCLRAGANAAAASADSVDRVFCARSRGDQRLQDEPADRA